MLGLAGEAGLPPAAQNPKRVAIIGAAPAGWKRACARPPGGAVRHRHRNRRGATPDALAGRGDMAASSTIKPPGRTSSGRPHLGRHANVEVYTPSTPRR